MSTRYPPLSENLHKMLQSVPPSRPARDLVYYPCRVGLKSGTAADRVYFCEAASWFHYWGIWPEDDPGKSSLSLDDVSFLESSPTRLPAPLANTLYEAGESGMGYVIFTLIFDDGTSAAYLTGNAVDFIDYPSGLGPANVIDVAPHEGRQDPSLRRGPDYSWCLYSAGRSGRPYPRPR